MECYGMTWDLFGILVAFALLRDGRQLSCWNHTHLKYSHLVCHLCLVSEALAPEVTMCSSLYALP